MMQTGHVDFSAVLTKARLVELISKKIKEIDFSLAKKEVEPFLRASGRKDELSLWSDAFFRDYLIREINVVAH
jgi:hypothetical protein